MLNDINLMGRLTRDPEVKETKSGVKVAKFTVACERDFKDASGERVADFIDCTAWRGVAEFIGKYFHKGDMIALTGRMQSEKWQDQEGKNRVSWGVSVGSVYFGGARSNEENVQTKQAPAPVEIEADDDLPF